MRKFIETSNAHKLTYDEIFAIVPSWTMAYTLTDRGIWAFSTIEERNQFNAVNA